MSAQNVAPSTVAKRRRLLSRHLLPEWESTPLCDINLFTAKAWGAKQTCSPTTVGHALTLLSMILTGAADAGLLLANPMFGRTRKTGQAAHAAARNAAKAAVAWAQPDEAHRIGERLNGVARLMVLTTAWTGLRWGELAGLHRDNCLLLRRDRVDGKTFVRHVIRIDPEVGALHEVEFELTEEERAAWREAEDARIATAVAAGKSPRRRKDPEHRVELYLGPPKNGTSAREVDVPPFLADLLAAHLAAWPHQYVFSTPTDGTFWRRGNFGRQQLRPAADGRPAIERKRGHAGRHAWEPILPGVTMRWLRHTHDTWMKEDRIDRALRYQRMGWAVRDIEGVYEHVTPQMRRELLDALEARWQRACGAGAGVTVLRPTGS
jgi:integrase